MVGLVDEHDGRLRHGVKEGRKRSSWCDCSGGVVGVADVDKAAVRHRAHGVQVVGIGRVERDIDDVGVGAGRRGRECLEGGGGEDELAVRTEEGRCSDAKDLAGAGSEEDLLGADAMQCGQFLDERIL